jgi:hypothetical protein
VGYNHPLAVLLIHGIWQVRTIDASLDALFVAPVDFIGDEVPVTDELLQLADEVQYTQPTV